MRSDVDRIFFDALELAEKLKPFVDAADTASAFTKAFAVARREAANAALAYIQAHNDAEGDDRP